MNSLLWLLVTSLLNRHGFSCETELALVLRPIWISSRVIQGPDPQQDVIGSTSICFDIKRIDFFFNSMFRSTLMSRF